LIPKGYGPLVLEPNHARSFEARRGDAHEFIEEDVGIRSLTRFGMTRVKSLTGSPATRRVRYKSARIDLVARLLPRGSVCESKETVE
jgi:hypothetical protein